MDDREAVWQMLVDHMNADDSSSTSSDEEYCGLKYGDQICEAK